MIAASFVELRRLQEAAVRELRVLHFPCGELERADNPGLLMLEATRAGAMILAARSIALKLPGDAYGRALDLTHPAATAIDQLHAAALDEFSVTPERRVG